MSFYFKKVSSEEYQTLILDAKEIERDPYGIKVYLLNNGKYLKLFRTKRLISSAIVFPYALRFKRNANKLSQLNVPTVSVETVFSVPTIKRHGVIYNPLEGQTVRDYAKKNSVDEEFFYSLGKFLAELHQKGIYFRSVHFGNIIITPDKQLGLIDVADMKIRPFSLGHLKRLRNLKHLLHYKGDIKLLPESQVLEKGYLSFSQIQNKFFIKHLYRIISELKDSV